MPTVRINGTEISVDEGTLILDAARRSGFYIPTYCYQVDLIGIGACRMCIVEIEGQPKLVASCVTPVMNGMNIFTESEKVNAARSAMLEFLLANHGLDCPVCDKGGECELQDYVYKYGPHTGRFAETKYRWHEKDYIISPVIVKNSNRCVQCMKCVRVCQEIVGRDVLGGLYRGEHQEETSFFRGMLDCDQDGNCIEVCPVGCFMRLPFRYKTRPWDLNSADTICPYCATGCRMVIEERDGQVIRSRAQLGVGINSETLCARGRFGYDIIHHPDRLTTPLIKRNGKLASATWDEALDLIRQRLLPAEPMKIGGIASARLTNEEHYLFQKLFRRIFNSPNIDSSIRWDPSAVKAFVAAAGMNSGGVSVFDCMATDCVLIIGTHLSDENPVTDYMVRRMARENNTAVLIASPRAMKLDSSARLSIRHLPGAEKEVLTAIARALGNDIWDKVSTSARLAALKEIPPEDCLRAAAVEQDHIDYVAEQLRNAGTVGIMVGTEFLRFPQGCAGLALLTEVFKTLEKPATVVPILDRSNQRGAWEMGVHPEFASGYRNAAQPGLGHAAMFAAAEKGDLESLYIIGEDPLAACPDQDFVKSALSGANFLLVQDIFMTATARMADCVLPGSCFAEKDGTFTNQEGRVQAIKRLMKPPGKAFCDREIIAAIGRLYDPAFTPRTKSSAPVFEEIRQQIGMYRDVNLDFVNKRNEDNDLDNQEALIKPAAVEVNADFLTLPAPAGADEETLFTLITGNHLFHSGRLSRKSELLNRLLQEPVVEISLEDATALGLAGGEKVRVKGNHYEAVLKLKTKRGSKSKVAFIDENFEKGAVNRFFASGVFWAKVSIYKIEE
ncbi:NADH-ubiquinone oxidoreductase chain G (EC [Olavius sp. associated proteobacterium Delta 1]|nr:NADH-ubiquinone oxidoreductase chain G (EC [Olavius sp. associated proteobacterium Delta 1]